MTETIRLPGTGRPPALADRPISPVKWWAALGAAALVFQAVMLIRWISGPYFARVDPGPTPLPGWMKIALIGLQIALPIAAAVVLYWFVVRPWRRERRIGLDGMMAMSFLTLAFHDPLSAYVNH
ncbi:MAG TPA: DUF5135 domain-containing protein, partial [Mycobacterium sp.]